MELTESRFVETPRGRFHVRMTADSAAGVGDAGDAAGTAGTAGTVPVVLVHGWPQSSYCWVPMVRHLPAGYRVIAPDLRGLGDSVRTPQQQAYEKDQLAQDMWAVLDALGVAECHLVGHDWGGVVVQEMAWAQAQRLRSLALLNISLINNPRGQQLAMDKHRAKGNIGHWYQQFQRMPGGLFEALVTGREAQWLAFCFATTPARPGQLQVTQDAFDEYLRMFRIPGTPGCGACYYRTMSADVQRWQQYAGQRYPMPALYLYGKQDAVVIPEYLQHHEDCFAQLHGLHEIDAGHFVQEQAPEQVARHLLAFWQGL